jgi:hypothetical protein
MLLTLSLQSLQFPVHFTNCKSYKLSIITRSITETKKISKISRKEEGKETNLSQSGTETSSILLQYTTTYYDTQKLCSRLNYQRSQASGTLTHRFLCSHCKCAVQQQQQQRAVVNPTSSLKNRTNSQDKFPGQFRLLFCLRTECR